MTSIEVSRLHHPVTALGYGRRAGIWLQGCTLACEGCMSRDTWPSRPEQAVPVADVLAWLASLPQPVDGVTISGGEPLEQPDALTELLDGIAAWRDGRELDLLLYTGYEWSLASRHDVIRQRCDAVVAGRYVKRLDTGQTPLRGSANQRIVTLSALGFSRYGPTAPPTAGGLQAGVANDRIWIVGIPRPGDLDRLTSRMAVRGVNLQGPSWKP